MMLNIEWTCVAASWSFFRIGRYSEIRNNFIHVGIFFHIFLSFLYYSTTAHIHQLPVCSVDREEWEKRGKITQFRQFCWRHVMSFVSENEKHLSLSLNEIFDVHSLPHQLGSCKSSLSMLYDELIVSGWNCEDVKRWTFDWARTGGKIFNHCNIEN